MNKTLRLLIQTFLIFAVIIGLSYKIYGQELMNEGDKILSLTNSIYRADDRLLNGKYYVPKHFFAEGHPYFLSNNWVNSTLFIKGIQYDEVPLKYNIEDDVLIIKTVFENRISKDILLHNSFVDSLIIGTHIFHNTSNQVQDNSIGIAEVIYNGKNKAYFKHIIEFKDELSDRLRYGKYLRPKKYLYLFNGVSYFLMQKNKEIQNYFPNHSQEVKIYMRKNQIRIKKASNEQIVNLIHFCEQL